MSSIVNWLRAYAARKTVVDLTRIDEAADRIIRLEIALRDVLQETANHHSENETRAKLGGSDMAKRKAKAIVARSGVLLHNVRFIAREVLEDKCSSS